MVQDILIEARRLIDEVGWTQHLSWRYDDDNKVTCFCAFGAITWAVSKNDRPTKDDVVKIDCARRVLECFTGNVYTWNDRVSQTKDNVILMFDNAIAFSQK